MKNQEIFNDYDMVVSITQKTINDQLTHLLKMGVIHPEFIVIQNIENGNYVYKVLESADQIPKDSKGNPTVAFIDGAVWPQINISESGTNVTFILNFRSGTAYFWVGDGPLAQLTRFDMTGWKYGVSITMDLKAVERDDIGKKIRVPDIVKNQLYQFMDNMFTVNHLFMDFESTDLLKFDPTNTDTKEVGDVGKKQLAEFMQFYLIDLIRQGNPYILGYSLTTTEQTKIPADQNVPDSLKPVGTTFTMYHDPDHQDLSSLNFVLVTKGGHGRVSGSPGNFDSNWISPTEQCDAKMIYSNSVLIEQFFLKPIFNQMYEKVYEQMGRGHIDVPQGNDYNRAKQLTATGFKYDISNIAHGDDRYVNNYSVEFANNGSRVDLKLNGHLYVYKEISKDLPFPFLCTAEASASGTIDWSGSISIMSSKNNHGEPTLTVAKGFKIDKHDSSRDENSCAKAAEIIGSILENILQIFIGFIDQGLLSKLFEDAFVIQVPGIGDVGVVFGNMINSIGNVIILPAGQVFFFKNPASDALGNFYLELTYKSEN